MLTLSKSRQQSFGEAINELKLMPVSISYEYDPCIIEKTKELYAAAQGEDYIKGEFEDLDSIQKGFLGYKGRVQMQQSKNAYGLDQLKQQWPDEDWLQAEAKFKDHLQLVPQEQRSLVIDAYAAPVKNQLDYLQQQSVADNPNNEEAIVC